MNTLPISACLIVRNEEEMLEECLEHLAPYSSEIIVVDTGSTDSTIDIAQGAASRVEKLEWKDDFSAARNYAASLATQPWILFIDGDELLTADGFQKIRFAVDNPTTFAYCLVQRNYSNDYRAVGWKSNQTQVLSKIPCRARRFLGFFDNLMGRLYRNQTGIEWRGLVHEDIIPSCREHGHKIASLPAVLHHFGKTRGASFLNQKDNYYLKLTLEKLKTEPENPAAWMEMGNNLAALKQFSSAERAFAKAVDLLPSWTEAKLLWGITLCNLDQFQTAERLLRDVLRENPENEEALCHLSTALLNTGQFDECERILQKVLSVNPFLYLAQLNAGILDFELKNYSQSFFHFEEVLKISPADTFARTAIEKIRKATPYQSSASFKENEAS